MARRRKRGGAAPGSGAQAQEPEEGAAQGTLVPEERREALPAVLGVGEPVAVVPVPGAEPIQLAYLMALPKTVSCSVMDASLTKEASCRRFSSPSRFVGQ